MQIQLESKSEEEFINALQSIEAEIKKEVIGTEIFFVNNLPDKFTVEIDESFPKLKLSVVSLTERRKTDRRKIERAINRSSDSDHLSFYIKWIKSTDISKKVAGLVAIDDLLKQDKALLKNTKIKGLIKEGLKNNSSYVRYRAVEIISHHSKYYLSDFKLQIMNLYKGKNFAKRIEKVLQSPKK
ncbi:MAG: hypothetical protein IPM36_23275 [Lewinellaceae bacterium]|nr:hypothetical protein [Lewinellaceae bacterium]